MDLPDLLWRPLALLLRAALWLAWEGLFQALGWWVGWCVCRTLSLGQFPRYGLQDPSKVPMGMRLLVELLGLGALGALLWAVLTRL